MWTVSVLVGIASLVALMLAIPVSLRFSLHRDGGLRYSMRIHWLFGLVSGGWTGPSAKPGPKAITPSGRHEGKKGSRGWLIFRAVLGTEDLAGQCLLLVRRTLSAFKERELRICLRVGLGDPAETGFLFAFIGPLAAGLRSVGSLDLWVVPDFAKVALEGKFQGSIAVAPLNLLWPLVLFLFSPPALKAVWAMAHK